MEIVNYNGTTLAYIGDAVMSLLVRKLLVSQGCQKPKVLQKQSEAWVSAKAQERFLNALLAENFFHEDEMAIILRGRNAKTNSIAKNASVQTYRMATGLEAVFGFLELTGKQERLLELWERMKELGEDK